MKHIPRLAALFLVGCGAPPQAQDRPEPLSARDRIEQATVQILDGAAAHAGVLVEDGRLVLGAAHCVSRARLGRRYRVRFRDGLVLSARLVRKDDRLDLALYALSSRSNRQPLPWPPGTGDALPAGMLVLAAGHPKGVPWAVAMGEVVGEQPLPGVAMPLLALRLATFPGASGGPVACAEGHLVGLVVRARDDDAMGYAVPARFVRRFVAGDAGQLPRVIVYSAPGCGLCRAVKRYLRRHRVSFEERDASNERVWRELVALAASRGVTVKGVPVVLIGNRLIDGFDEEELENALREAGLDGEHP